MSKGLNILGAVFATIFSIALFGILLSMIVINGLKSTFNKSTVNKIVKEIDVNELIDKIGDDGMHGFYQAAEEKGFSREAINSILQDANVKELFSNYMYGIGEYFIEGNEEHLISAEYYNNFIDAHFDEIVNKYNISFDIDKEVIKYNLKIREEEYVSFYKKQKDYVNNKIDFEVLKDVRRFASRNIMLILAFVAIIFATIIGFCRMSYYKWMTWAGMAAIYAGVISMLIGALPLLGILYGTKEEFFYIILKIFDMVGDIVFKNFLTGGLLVLTLGIALLSLGRYFDKKAKEKESNKSQLNNNQVVNEQPVNNQNIPNNYFPNTNSNIGMNNPNYQGMNNQNMYNNQQNNYNNYYQNNANMNNQYYNGNSGQNYQANQYQQPNNNNQNRVINNNQRKY